MGPHLEVGLHPTEFTQPQTAPYSCPCSWSTCNPLLEQHAVPVKFECDADEAPGQQVLSFGRAGGAGAGAASAGPPGGAASSGAGRHSFFRARKLQRAQLAF